MTIASNISRTDSLGNGATSVYPYSFRVVNEEHLLVTVRNTEGVETTLALSADYTVSGVGATSGGSITLVNSGQSWLTAGKLKSDYVLTIRRVVDVKQETDIRNQGDFYPEAHEDALDYLTMIAQQQQDAMDRSVKLPETLAAAGFDATLPALLADYPGFTLVINATGDGFSLGPSGDLIANAQLAAAAAEAVLVDVNAVKDEAEDARDDAQAAAALATGAIDISVTRFSGTGAQTAFTLPIEPINTNNTLVYINGVYQQKNTYSVSGTTLAFSMAPPSGTNNIEVVTGKTLDIGTPSDNTVSTEKLVDTSVTTGKLADAAVTAPKVAEAVYSAVGVYGGASAGGTDTYAVTPSPAFTAYTAGMRISFKADVANTGACTLNVNALGAKNIKVFTNGVVADPADNAIPANGVVTVQYDGTQFLLIATGVSTGQRLVGVYSPSASSSLAITGLTAGTRYRLEFNLVWNTSAGKLQMRFNNDSGSNYKYEMTLANGAAIAARDGSGGGAFIYLTDPSTNVDVSGQVVGATTFQAQPGTLTKAMAIGNTTHISSSTPLVATAAGSYAGASNVTEVDLLASAGTFTGSVLLYALNG